MAAFARFTALLLAALLAGHADARATSVTDEDYPRALEGDAAVAVSWTDPAEFSEIRNSRNRWEARRGDWVRQLAEHLRDEASGHLAPGERLEVVITDIERAGDYEPAAGRGQDIRIIREIYPPRLSLRYTRIDGNGKVVDEGERKLVDMGFMTSGAGRLDSDPLRYEKRLIDDWVRRDLRAPGA